jgi:NAD(P)-dependent dehydrogenase (short-subunit alcohol dehydrogenase family)
VSANKGTTMAMSDIPALARQACDEIATVFTPATTDVANRLCDEIDRARRIACHGVGRGIGAAARELASLGARLEFADRNEAELAATVAAITATDGDAIPVQTYVRRYADTERLRDACLERFNQLDFIVAKAGISDACSMADDAGGVMGYRLSAVSQRMKSEAERHP